MDEQLKRYQFIGKETDRNDLSFWRETPDGKWMLAEDVQALNQDKDHFKGNTLKAAFAELRAVNERLVQDVKRHMQREEALRQALEEAAQSLRTIEQKAGKDEFLINIFDVRGYAYSRASAARAALEATEGDAPW